MPLGQLSAVFSGRELAFGRIKIYLADMFSRQCEFIVIFFPGTFPIF